MSDGWWKEWKAAEKQRDELLDFFKALGQAPSGADSEDLVLRQEHRAVLARIEARKAVLLASVPTLSHLIVGLVTALLGYGLGRLVP